MSDTRGLCTRKEGKKYLMAHYTHFIQLYGADLWYTTTQIRKETCCHHYMSYSYQLATRGIYINHITDRIAHTMTFVIIVME